MKLRTLFIASSITLLLFTIGVGVMVWYATHITNAIAAQSVQAGKLTTQVFELNALAYQYTTNKEERAKTQWYLIYSQMGEVLSLPVFQSRPSQIFYSDLQADMGEIKNSFDSLVSYSSLPNNNNAIIQELNDDLLVKTQRMITVVDALSQRTFQERSAMRSQTDLLIFGLLAMLAILPNIILLVIYRRIAGSSGVSLAGVENAEKQSDL